MAIFMSGGRNIPSIFKLCVVERGTYSILKEYEYQYETGMTWNDFISSGLSSSNFTATTDGYVTTSTKFDYSSARGNYIHLNKQYDASERVSTSDNVNKQSVYYVIG